MSDNQPTDLADASAKKPRGHIDIVALFQAEAFDLAAAVQKGRLLHRTRNIRESGGPLETALRTFFRTRLPAQFEVANGYAFDIASKCTPQIDVMILRASDRHQLMTSAESVYVPFTSVLATLEVKNSTSDVSGSLSQAAAVQAAIDEMRVDLSKRAAKARIPMGASLARPFSILFFGESADSRLQDFRDWYSRPTGPMPAYTVLLDRGIIIARQPLHFKPDAGPVSFYDQREPGIPFLCVPEIADDSVQGRVLLWLYFSMVAHTNLSEGNVGAISAFTLDAEQSYALRAVAPLNEVHDWSAWETLRRESTPP